MSRRLLSILGIQIFFLDSLPFARGWARVLTARYLPVQNIVKVVALGPSRQRLAFGLHVDELFVEFHYSG